jgi:hypothetical protein
MHGDIGEIVDFLVLRLTTANRPEARFDVSEFYPCEALETELGGVEVYKTSLKCIVNDDLKKEWEEYLEQTQNHVQVVRGVFEKLKLDAEAETQGGKLCDTSVSLL